MKNYVLQHCTFVASVCQFDRDIGQYDSVSRSWLMENDTKCN